MAEKAARYWFGTVRRFVDGSLVEYDVCRCSPGDWPEVRAELPKGEDWSTLRCGTELLAFSPFRHSAPMASLIGRADMAESRERAGRIGRNVMDRRAGLG